MTTEQPPWCVGVRTLRLDTPDPGAAEAFYETLTYPAERAAVRVQVSPHRHPGTARWIVGFGVTDLAGAAGVCADLGAKVVAGPDGSYLVADPQGITFELVGAEPAPGEPAGRGDVVLADVYTRDVETATAFYSAALRLRVDLLPDEPVDYTMLSAGGQHLAGVLDMTSFLDPATEDHWMPYFHFPDIDAGIERATALGAWVVVPRTASPTGDYALLQDSWGCLFGIWDAQTRHRSPGSHGAAAHPSAR
ncbi:VOC family protein [Amycolatopsis jejuensis]|uniref:VOC family protein n=1 Tax=Amycolatopsis jejuensis TaxID=330084 RepID=UPI0005273F94|nr:VOC family protein [Amycolatopsis jejuensis]